MYQQTKLLFLTFIFPFKDVQSKRVLEINVTASLLNEKWDSQMEIISSPSSQNLKSKIEVGVRFSFFFFFFFFFKCFNKCLD